ncbi:MAG: hypothetical protein JRG97_12935 [Deltaproteobacteria bacterium]|nr:hypothetical protein [Deltaproteobacteria bacterium]MBW2053370.1 hypothetical protein [Deltaproteobacteria bacterium]MBW2141953.1 hypothetical protein [Deltaproteobacteria bacterium]MBW2323636.1 hypothetical protein [Deltaproteobacteria bacterium]
MRTDVLTEQIVIGEELARRLGLKKGLELIRKACAASLAKEAVNNEERSIISVISTGDVDRDGDVLRPDGMDDSAFRRHPIVLFGHIYRELPIGRNEWIRVLGKKIIAKTIYAPGDINPLAEKIFRFRQQGFPLAQSIGFIAVEAVWADEDGFQTELDDVVSRGWVRKDQRKMVRRIIKKWTLYEYSDVVVPANPEALALAVSKGLVTTSEADHHGELSANSQDLDLMEFKSAKDESALILGRLADRIEKAEMELETLKQEYADLKENRGNENFNGRTISLESLERMLPTITKAFQNEVKATSCELARTLARLTGTVTLPR